MSQEKIRSPKMSKPKNFTDAREAVEYIQQIYDQQTQFLHDHFVDFTKGNMPPQRVRGFYPYVKVTTIKAKRSDKRLAYGFVPYPGSFQTTLTRPDIFAYYYTRQLDLLIKNHDVPVEVGISDTPIPVHFALGDSFHVEEDLSTEEAGVITDYFDVPNLDIMDDEIANCAFIPGHHGSDDQPLSLFTAPRVDISLQRLKHYTGTQCNHFQNYIIFTNYQFYIDEFVKIGESLAGKDGHGEFIQPDPDKRLPQMPAYHLKRKGHKGITMVNIGVGPSNAKTITDHIAVLRPHAWLMLGHCAGLRNSQKLGDYVLAHGYLRLDHILDEDLPPSIPIPALAEVQQSLEQAVATVTGEQGYDLKKIVRTGTVATTDDRNWELGRAQQQNQRLSQSRAIAMDMESGTIAANGFRFRVPYGTLLCVSDRPLHGELKLPGMADHFYRQRVEQHLQIGLLTMQLLRDYGEERLHSRKLRSFNEVAFQ